jgi:predicted RNase H-like HicB family nuclease
MTAKELRKGSWGKSPQDGRFFIFLNDYRFDILAAGAGVMTFTVDFEQEEDGRWIAEVLELPGVMVYGATKEEAQAKAQALALRVLAERLEHGEMPAEPINILFAAA